MPFTVSHAAAVLPLHRWLKLPLTALMVGSMAPDFGYFVSHRADRGLTHGFSGLFLFCLPVGLAVWLFYVALLEKAAITLLPDRWHTRFAHTDALTPGLIARAGAAIVLGAMTHVIWDAFTHRGTFVTDAILALRGPTPGFSWMPIYHVLHGVSTAIGLVVLAFWARNLHRQPARSQIRPYDISERARIGALWFLLAATLLVGIAEWMPHSHRRYDTQLFTFTVGACSGFFIAWCCLALGMWLQARRAKARRE